MSDLQSSYNPFIKLTDTNGARQTRSRGQEAGRFSGNRQQRQTRNRQSGKRVGKQAGSKRWKVSHITEHNLAGASHKSRPYILVQISGRSTSGEKWENTAGRPAGADWPMLEAWLIRRRGTAEAMRSGETPLADW